uniref:F-box domain-containing protein n=1 Tax=Kalanchoe fedtschenkoi TaxID=63787 RepID=A0A7N1A0K4_KALFE
MVIFEKPEKTVSQPELHEDLIREVLLKLPVKSLLRFKQVSKTWLQMVTSKAFISDHYSVARNRQSDPSFFVIRNPIYNKYRAVNVITQISMEASGIRTDKNIPLRFIGRCGERYTFPVFFPMGFGLYCIFEFLSQTIVLWNFGTRKFEVLPLSPYRDRANPELDPSFCFAHVDDEFSYKVGLLSVRRYSKNKNSVLVQRLQLYSSSSGSWKVILIPEGSVVRYYMANGVNLNGKYHILSTDSKNQEHDYNHGGFEEQNDNSYIYDYHIMSFDYASEVFGRIEVPDPPQITGRYNLMDKLFLISNDGILLCLVIPWVNEDVNNEKFLDVWVMHDYGAKESWSKEHTVGPISNNMHGLGYSKSVKGFFFQDCDSQLYLFKCASSAAERIILHHLDFEMTNVQVIEHTAESLISIKGTSRSGLK